MSVLKKALLLVILIIAIDQVVKIWVKTTMFLGEDIAVFGNWFYIHFIENEGMAFGWKLGGGSGKIILSIFRVVAIFAIGWYIRELDKNDAPKGLIISIAMILAGAIGNIIDSAIYGVIFSDSMLSVAQFMPDGNGYSGFLKGNVVDMFYFPVIEGHYPDWFPFWKNQRFIFFRPVFNIADSAITIGVASILLFQRKFFTKSEKVATE